MLNACVIIYLCIVYVDSQPLQWKICKTFASNSSKVLDVQFGISLTHLKMVSFIATKNFINIYVGTIFLKSEFQMAISNYSHQFI